VIRAAIELDQKNAAGAIEILRKAAPYDFAYPNPQVGVGRFLYPPYILPIFVARLTCNCSGRTKRSPSIGNFWIIQSS
jgi:hypothetical protein